LGFGIVVELFLLFACVRMCIASCAKSLFAWVLAAAVCELVGVACVRRWLCDLKIFLIDVRTRVPEVKSKIQRALYIQQYPCGSALELNTQQVWVAVNIQQSECAKCQAACAVVLCLCFWDCAYTTWELGF